MKISIRCDLFTGCFHPQLIPVIFVLYSIDTVQNIIYTSTQPGGTVQKQPAFKVAAFAEPASFMPLPMLISRVQAGFPSPADDYIDRSVDLNTELIKRPSSTYLIKVSGTSMQDAGIFDGDLLVVDRSVKPKTGRLAVCCVDGQFTIKLIKVEADAVILLPANCEFKPIRVTAENDLVIWGIVLHAIRSF